MSSSPADLFVVARHLAAQAHPSCGEAFARSAVSRAYYAAFWRVRGHVDARRLEPKPTTRTKGDHDVAIWSCIDSTDPRDKLVGRHLHNLRALRVTADYLHTTTVSPIDAANALRVARELFDTLDGTPPAAR